MLPQISRDSVLVGPVCLPLAKYSYATVSNDSISPIPWIHLASKNDMFAVFDTFRIHSSQGDVMDSKMFKVTRGADLMEHIDLDTLADEGRKAQVARKDPGMHSKTQDVAIIIKTPVVAIRYPLPGNQIRRFQIRFLSEEDYFEAMKWFSRAKVPVEEAGMYPRRGPATAQSAQLPTNDSVSLAGSRPISLASCGTLGPSSGPPPSGLIPSFSNNGLRAPNHAFCKPPPPLYHQSSTWRGSKSHEQRQTHGADSHRQSTGPIPQPTAEDLSAKVIPGAPPISSEVPQPAISLQPALGANKTPLSQYLSTTKPLPQSGIDIYVPRGSTAPEAPSHHLSQDMPPKRELPFSSTRSTLRTSKIGSDNEASASAAQVFPSTPQDQILPPPPTQGPGKGQLTVATSSKKKRATSKAHLKSPAVKKPRLAATRKKTAAAKTVNQSPVLSVEELLNKSQVSEAENAHQVIDTQALLARAERKAATISTIFATQPKTPSPQHALSECSGPDCATTESREAVAPFGGFPGPSKLDPEPLSGLRQPLGELDQNVVAPSTTSTATFCKPGPTMGSCTDSHPPHHLGEQTAFATALRHPGLGRPAPASLTTSIPRLSSPCTSHEPTADIWCLQEEQTGRLLDDFVCQELNKPDFMKLLIWMEGTWKGRLVLG